MSAVYSANSATVYGRRQALAIALALALGFGMICLVSHEPFHAFYTLLTGAMPQFSWSSDAGWRVYRLARFGAVIENAITLSLLGLAVLFGFRAKQFSMGADGQFFLGALAAAYVSTQLSGWPLSGLFIAASAAMLVGFCWGWIPGLLKARFGANEIVTTLMLNVIAVQLYRLIITYGFNDTSSGFIVTPTVPATLPTTSLMAHTNITLLFLLTPIASWVAWCVLERTTLGYEIRVVGDAPAFASQTGIPVQRVIALSMAMGGVFAGLAGLHVSHALLKRLPVDLTPGIGFEGLMIALLARNDPKAVPFAALMYSYLKVGAQAMEQASDVSRDMVLVIQSFIVLFVVSERLISPTTLRWTTTRWRQLARRSAA